MGYRSGQIKCELFDHSSPREIIEILKGLLPDGTEEEKKIKSKLNMTMWNNIRKPERQRTLQPEELDLINKIVLNNL